MENDANVFRNYTDENGNVLFRLKSCEDTFTYSFRQADPDTCLGLFCAYLLRRIDRQEKKLAALERSLLAMSKEKRVQMRTVSPPTLRTPDSLRDTAPVRPGVSRPP